MARKEQHILLRCGLPVALGLAIVLIAWAGWGSRECVLRTVPDDSAWRANSIAASELVLPLKTPKGPGILGQVADYRAVFAEVYAPRHYSVCKTAKGPTCWPRLQVAVDCQQLFAEYGRILHAHVPVAPAPRQLPAGQEAEFLLNGYSLLSESYHAEPNWAPGAAVVEWKADYIQGLVQEAKSRKSPFGIYGNEVQHMYAAIECHGIKGLHGAVFGTEEPWVEAILFAHGAQRVTTIEFRATVSHAPHHVVVRPADWVRGWQNGSMATVDFAVSYSSWEHDGLGRYGDPVDPWGDVKAMQRASCYVKPGGLMFLGVPSSAFDQLQYNAHRIYGAVRFPLMTANWEVLGVYEAGWMPFEGTCGSSTCNGLLSHWAATVGAESIFQPVVVLQNQRTVPCRLEF